jgi:hypothetical protein
LIHVWEELGTTPETWGWIAPILDGARSQGKLAGLPFAAEADVFAFRPQAYSSPPHTWADLLTGNGSFVFPAGDPRSFTLAQYLSVGGTLRTRADLPRSTPSCCKMCSPSTPRHAPADFCLSRPVSTRTAA